MTNNSTPHPDDDSHHLPVDPLRPDRLHCLCGATADRDGRCRKCRARALFDRRTTGRRSRPDRPPSRRHESPPADRTRPAGRKDAS